MLSALEAPRWRGSVGSRITFPANHPMYLSPSRGAWSSGPSHRTQAHDALSSRMAEPSVKKCRKGRSSRESVLAVSSQCLVDSCGIHSSGRSRGRSKVHRLVYLSKWSKCGTCTCDVCVVCASPLVGSGIKSSSLMQVLGKLALQVAAGPNRVSSEMGRIGGCEDWLPRWSQNWLPGECETCCEWCLTLPWTNCTAEAIPSSSETKLESWLVGPGSSHSVLLFSLVTSPVGSFELADLMEMCESSVSDSLSICLASSCSASSKGSVECDLTWLGVRSKLSKVQRSSGISFTSKKNPWSINHPCSWALTCLPFKVISMTYPSVGRLSCAKIVSKDKGVNPAHACRSQWMSLSLSMMPSAKMPPFHASRPGYWAVSTTTMWSMSSSMASQAVKLSWSMTLIHSRCSKSCQMCRATSSISSDRSCPSCPRRWMRWDSGWSGFSCPGLIGLHNLTSPSLGGQSLSCPLKGGPFGSSSPEGSSGPVAIPSSSLGVRGSSSWCCQWCTMRSTVAYPCGICLASTGFQLFSQAGMAGILSLLSCCEIPFSHSQPGGREVLVGQEQSRSSLPWWAKASPSLYRSLRWSPRCRWARRRSVWRLLPRTSGHL